MVAFGLSAEEQALAERVRAIAEADLLPIAEAWGERYEICRDLIEAIAGHGLYGLNIDEAYGGQGGEHRYSTVLCLLRESLGFVHPTIDFHYGLQGLGTIAIVREGNDEQRAAYLPDLVAGRRVFALAMTEPQSGSDVVGITTAARRDGGDWVLDGTKTFISGVPDSDVYVVLARTDGQPRGRGISAFIVEKGTGGFTAKQDLPLSAPHAIGTLEFQGCRVPDRNLVGAVGDGLGVAFGALEVFRPSVGALSVGMGDRAFELARDFAAERRIQERSLLSFEATRLKLARMWAELRMARALVYRTAGLRDVGEDTTREAGMAKLLSTEASWRAIYESQQIHGGRGVLVGSLIEELSRHARQATIYEGTSEIQRVIIGRAEAARPGERRTGELPEGASEALRVASGELGAFLSWATSQEGLLRRQGVQFRVADAAVTVDAAATLGAQAPSSDEHARSAEFADTHAAETVAHMLREMSRLAGYDPAASDRVLVARSNRATDDILLELADLLLLHS